MQFAKVNTMLKSRKGKVGKAAPKATVDQAVVDSVTDPTLKGLLQHLLDKGGSITQEPPRPPKNPVADLMSALGLKHGDDLYFGPPPSEDQPKKAEVVAKPKKSRKKR